MKMPEKQEAATEAEKSENSYEANVKQILLDALNASTVHGISEIYRHKSLVLRIGLSIYIACSVSYCIYNIIDTLLVFLSYEVTTNVKIHYEAPTPFPVVQLCNLNAFDQNYAYDAIKNITSDGKINLNDYRAAIEYTAELNSYFRANLIKMNLQNPYLLKYYSYFLDQLLISCRYEDQNCNQSEFLQFYDFYFGLCHRYNQGYDSTGRVIPIKTSGQSGWKYGLQLELFAGDSELQDKFITNRGFRILVFNQSEYYQIALDEGVNVATGQETNIAVRRVFLKHLPSPYGNCLNSDNTKIDWNQNDVLAFMYSNFILNNYYDNGNFTHNLTLTYTQFVCLKCCFQKFLLSYCGCYDITLPKSQSLTQLYADRACSNTSQLNCTQEAQALFYDSSRLSGECYDKCPLECNQVMYQLSISTSTYPTKWYGQILVNSSSFQDVLAANNLNQNNTTDYSTNFQELQRSIAKVNVFYEDMLYTELSESPAISSSILLGTLGGSLGLFFGASLVTLSEAIALIYTLIEYFVKRAIRRSQNEKQEHKPGSFSAIHY